MGTRTGIILGLGIGFVLGARAGRERYEQIREASKRVRQLPIVSRPLDAAGEKAADMVRNKGNEISDGIAEVVKEKLFGMEPERMTIEATIVDQVNQRPENPRSGSGTRTL